jgi:hypothetical protein
MSVTAIQKQKLERAIKQLREITLMQGLPFMINSELLPSDHCYLEYPDGSVKVVVAHANRFDFKIIEELSFDEVRALKKKLKLD